MKYIYYILDQIPGLTKKLPRDIWLNVGDVLVEDFKRVVREFDVKFASIAIFNGYTTYLRGTPRYQLFSGRHSWIIDYGVAAIYFQHYFRDYDFYHSTSRYFPLEPLDEFIIL